MDQINGTFLSLSPEVAAFMTDNDISIADLLKKAKVPAEISLAEDPGGTVLGRKEPATIILASAAAIAAATPLLRELIRNITGRIPVIREKKLAQAVDVDGRPLLDKAGRPIMTWQEIERANVVGDKVSVRGFGIEISFEAN